MIPGTAFSATKPVESPALPLESVHHVHGSDSLPLGVLGVGDSVPNDVLQEHLDIAVGRSPFLMQLK